MMFLCLHSMLLIKCSYSLSTKISSSAELKIDSYCCCFIDNNNTFFITKSHHLLTIRIMTCSEAVSMLPLHNGYILCIHRQIYSTAIRKCIFVLSVTFKVKWLFINQKLCTIYSYTSYTIWKCIHILSCCYLYLIKISI